MKDVTEDLEHKTRKGKIDRAFDLKQDKEQCS